MEHRIFPGHIENKLINVSENYEVETWSNKFGVTPERLKAAVRAVGNSAVAVEAFINGTVIGKI